MALHKIDRSSQNGICMHKYLSLLDDISYMGYKFPIPQYLGAKYIHRKWIAQFIPKEVKTILDAFAGSQSIAYMFKQLGKQVITNDFLNFNCLIGKALVENPGFKLDGNDLKKLFSANSDPEKYNLIEKLYSDLFFPTEDAIFADSFRSNIWKLENPYKQSLALTIMCRSMTRKVTMGHFAHTCALVYASDPKRIKRNRSLASPLKSIFIDLVEEYNNAIFDNKKDNRSYNYNILELLPHLNNIDMVYFDPPYCNSHADYQSFYHLLETYIEYWKEKQFINKIRRYEPKKYSGFDKKNEVIENFNLMFKLSSSIPNWLISYHDRSYPHIDLMIKMIEPYRKVVIAKKTYNMSRGGKGSVAGSNEVLLICTMKQEN